MSKLAMGGVVLALLGILGFAIPIFTTERAKDVAKIGDMQLQATERTSHIVPPMLAGGVLILGIVLVGVSGLRRRQD